jgi:hypothetical protein
MYTNSRGVPPRLRYQRNFQSDRPRPKRGPSSGWGSVIKDAKAVRHPASQEKQHQRRWIEALIESIRKDAKGKKKLPLIKIPWWVIRRIFLGAKKNRLSPWGEEKIDNAVWRESPCRRNEIDSCREAKKNQLLPWGEKKLISPWDVNRRQAD